MTTPKHPPHRPPPPTASWWDHDAADYHSRHASYLDGSHWYGDARRADARLLGMQPGRPRDGCDPPRASYGASFQRLRHRLTFRTRCSPTPTAAALTQADAQALPYRDASSTPPPRALPSSLTSHRCYRRRPFSAPAAAHLLSTTPRVEFPDDPQAFEAQISYFEREYVEQTRAAPSPTRSSTAPRRLPGLMPPVPPARPLEPDWPTPPERGQWSPSAVSIFPAPPSSWKR